MDANADPARQRIEQLAVELQRLNDAYYGAGDSPLPDADFDALKDELAALVAEHPELAPADNPLDRVNQPSQLRGPTVRHARPLLSLAKATTSEQIRAFCERFPAQEFRVSEKLDGLSLSVVYVDGELDYVATRGTGTVGELVTDKVRHVLPELPRQIAAAGRVELRGEAVMLRSVWQAYNAAHPDKILTNPRSGAAGTLMQKDPEAAALAGRLLRFYAFGADREGEALDVAPLGQFEQATTVVCADGDAVVAAIEAIGERRAGLDYETDGAVVRLHAPAAFRRRRLQLRRAARRDRLQVPARGAHDDVAGGRVAGRQGRPDRAQGARGARLRRRRHGREHHAAQSAPDRRARPAHRRHDRGRAPRRRDPVRGPRDRRGPRRLGGRDRRAAELPVLRRAAGDPRQRGGALVREPPLPGPGHAAAHALGVAPGGRHGGRRRRLDREARRRRPAAGRAATSTG